MPDQHHAGRELDTLMAEKVMGWKWVKCPALRRNYLASPSEAARASLSRLGKNPEWPAAQHEFIPAFSTDPAATKEVLTKLIADGWAWFMEGDSNGWVVQIEGAGDPHVHDVVSHYADAPTLELAICRAAMAVVESEETE